MDDASLYGEEMYRIGFGEAVEKKLLTDYKVLILTLNDKDVPPAVQKMIAGDEVEITFTRGGKEQTIYYFSKDDRAEGIEAVPAGMQVNENPRNGFLTVSRKK